jgi:hypothetical protein
MDSLYFAQDRDGRIHIGKTNDVHLRAIKLRASIVSQFPGIAPYMRRVRAALEGDALGDGWFKPSERVLALAASRTGAALLASAGVDCQNAFDPDEGTERDRAELLKAASLIAEGRALRRRVQTRMRQRRWREAREK